ncbi:MAG: acetyltransferase [Oligoflexia bacterium]|nr:acetyltransferase [Oligoflexia bacterium]
MSKKYIVLGAGGHAKVLIDLMKKSNLEIEGVLDLDVSKRGSNILGVPILGDEENLKKRGPKTVFLVNGLGSIKNTEPREKLFKKYFDLGFDFPNIVHPSAVVAEDVSFGFGVQIMAGVVVQSGTCLGNNVILNTRVSIDHDCNIADHVHIAPGCVLSGDISVGLGSHIGVGATIIQGVSVGSNALIGAGAVVLKNIKDKEVVVGVPARALN